MNGPDWISRALLLAILVCLVALLVQQAGAPPVFGRYQVTGMRAGAPVLIRTDTETGRVWKLELRGGGERWVAFSEPQDEASPSAEPERAEPPKAPAEHGAAPQEEQAPTVGAKPPPPAPTALPGAHPAPSSSQESQRLLDAANNRDLPADMRAWVIQQLMKLSPPPDSETLLRWVADPQPLVARAAIDALAGRSAADRATGLELGLRHPDPGVRQAAQKQLAAPAQKQVAAP